MGSRTGPSALVTVCGPAVIRQHPRVIGSAGVMRREIKASQKIPWAPLPACIFIKGKRTKKKERKKERKKKSTYMYEEYILLPFPPFPSSHFSILTFSFPLLRQKAGDFGLDLGRGDRRVVPLHDLAVAADEEGLKVPDDVGAGHGRPHSQVRVAKHGHVGRLDTVLDGHRDRRLLLEKLVQGVLQEEEEKKIRKLKN